MSSQSVAEARGLRQKIQRQEDVFPENVFRNSMEVSMAANNTQDSGKVFPLAEIVAYQQGSIVSREVIRKETGTVTVFAFDQGQGLSEHTAPFDALVHVLDGTVQIKIAGAPHELKAGDMIIMPANKPHALQALTCMKMMLVMIKS